MTNTGGPAFPVADMEATKEGMTLRDYFAAQCLASVMTARMPSAPAPDSVAKACYVLADAMLKARQQ